MCLSEEVSREEVANQSKVAHLSIHPPTLQVNHPFIRLVTDLLIHWFIDLMHWYWFLVSLIQLLFCWFIASLSHWFTGSVLHSFIALLVPDMGSLLHLFIDSFIHWLSDPPCVSLIHFFGPSSVHWFIVFLAHWFIESLVHWWSLIHAVNRATLMSFDWYLNDRFLICWCI